MYSRLWTSGGVSILEQGSRTTRPGDTTGVVIMGGYGAVAATSSEASPNDAPASQGFNTAWLSTGTSWGNSTQLANITTAINALQSSGWFPADPVFLYGGSAGGMVLTKWALANPSRVGALVTNIAPFDLQSIYDDNVLGLQSSVSAAYGGRPSDAENPVLRGDELTSIPIKVFYSNDDPVSYPSASQTFIADSGATAVNMGNQGHNWDSRLVNAQTVAAFFSEHS